MKRAKNRGVILTCKVGARMAPKRHKPGGRSRPMKGKFLCRSGPYAGRTITLDASSDLKSLTIRVRGEVGRYFGDNWVPC